MNSAYGQRGKQTPVPRILNLFLDHALGKPPEQIHQEQVVFIMSRKNTEAQDAEVMDGDQKSLPEGKEEIE